MNGTFKLLASPGTGSAIVEAMLVLKGIPYSIEDFEYERVVAGDPALAKTSPLSEVPALILPDGTVMTESAAILLFLDEIVRDATGMRDRLVPPAGTAERAKIYRWTLFLAATIYPTFTYGDVPERWVEGASNAVQLEASTDAYRKELWQLMENEASDGAYWLGDKLTVVDLYIGVMHYWRPGREWFDRHTPRLAKIAANVAKHPKLVAVWARNFRN
jgi:GST-like protein